MQTVLAPDAFYDELAPYFDTMFEDWDASMRRQGDAIAALLHRYLPGAAAPVRVLDASAGIGTQSLPLAALGFRVSSRDVSEAAVARLASEARRRGLGIDVRPSDMRTVAATVGEPFDAVISFDNAVAHLQTDGDLLAAFRAFHDCLRPGGICVLSVRDYAAIERKDAVHAYGVRVRDGVRHVPIQTWHWTSPTHYDATFYVIVDAEVPRVHRVTTRVYAVSIATLSALLVEAGFAACERLDGTIYQPVLVASKRGQGT